jgi:hypothetical protein
MSQGSRPRREVGPSLDQQDLVIGILGQAPGEDGAGRTGSDNNEIVNHTWTRAGDNGRVQGAILQLS